MQSLSDNYAVHIETLQQRTREGASGRRPYYTHGFEAICMVRPGRGANLLRGSPHGTLLQERWRVHRAIGLSQRAQHPRVPVDHMRS